MKAYRLVLNVDPEFSDGINEVLRSFPYLTMSEFIRRALGFTTQAIHHLNKESGDIMVFVNDSGHSVNRPFPAKGAYPAIRPGKAHAAKAFKMLEIRLAEVDKENLKTVAIYLGGATKTMSVAVAAGIYTDVLRYSTLEYKPFFKNQKTGCLAAAGEFSSSFLAVTSGVIGDPMSMEDMSSTICELNHQLECMKREREKLRRDCGANLHRMAHLTRNLLTADLQDPEDYLVAAISQLCDDLVDAAVGCHPPHFDFTVRVMILVARDKVMLIGERGGPTPRHRAPSRHWGGDAKKRYRISGNEFFESVMSPEHRSFRDGDDLIVPIRKSSESNPQEVDVLGFVCIHRESRDEDVVFTSEEAEEALTEHMLACGDSMYTYVKLYSKNKVVPYKMHGKIVDAYQKGGWRKTKMSFPAIA